MIKKTIIKIQKNYKKKNQMQKWQKHDFFDDPHLHVKVADNSQDYEKALNLMKTKTGQYCDLFDLLPQSKIIVLKYKDLVIGSVRVTFDTEIGLPSEFNFTTELDTLRKNKHRLIEISKLSIDLGFKHQSEIISHFIMKYIFQYFGALKTDCSFLFSTHPALTDFFCTYWNFSVLGPEIRTTSNPFSKRQLLFLGHFPKALKTDPDCVIKKFIENQDYRFSVPYSKNILFTPTLEAEDVDRLAFERTNLFDSLNTKQKKFFIEMYLQFYGQQRLEKFLHQEKELQLKEFRIPTMTQVQIRLDQMNLTGCILDISTQGCFIEMDKELEISPSQMTLQFRWGDHSYEIQGQVLWQNKSQMSRYPKGYGIRFEKAEELFISNLKPALAA